jgi:Transglycosylase-like domain
MTVLLAALMILTPAQKQDYRWTVVRPYDAKLVRMARCESTSRWFLNTGNGFYGGLQFDLSTWRSVGGSGYPHRNTILEQKYRAVKLIKRRGYGPWPRCRYA